MGLGEKIVKQMNRRIKVEFADPQTGDIKWEVLELPLTVTDRDIIAEAKKHGKMVGEIILLEYFETQTKQLSKLGMAAWMGVVAVAIDG